MNNTSFFFPGFLAGLTITMLLMTPTTPAQPGAGERSAPTSAHRSPAAAPIILTKHRDGQRVSRLSDSSPLKSLGIRQGDVLVTVDGTPARQLGAEQVVAKLNSLVGSPTNSNRDHHHISIAKATELVQSDPPQANKRTKRTHHRRVKRHRRTPVQPTKG